jgi:hypothetical protein
LSDPVPLPEAIRSLFRFLLRSTAAREGVLLARSHDPARQPAEIYRAYDTEGNALVVDLVAFSQSVAGTVVSLQRPSVMKQLGRDPTPEIALQPFERGRASLLAVPLAVGPGIHVVLELFDKQRGNGDLDERGFTETDQQMVSTAADLGVDLLRHALSERQTQQVLFDAIAAALNAGDSVAATLKDSASQRREQPPPGPVLDQLREGLRATGTPTADAEETLRLIEAIRVLSVSHGPAAVQHCTRLVEDLRALLDKVTAT